jgi:hypothetical protein
MKNTARFLFLAALVAATAMAGVITNTAGTLRVGIGPDGELYDSDARIGFQRTADGFDAILPGIPRDSWGISADGSYAYADYLQFGTVNITNTSAAYGANSALLDTTTSVGLAVQHLFAFAAPNILAITGTVTNITDATIASVLFQRNVDWDMTVGAFLETTSGAAVTRNVVDSSYFGFESASPADAFGYSCASGCTSTLGDWGAGIRISLGSLAAGESKSFRYLYGLGNVGQSPDELVAQAQGLGSYYHMVTTGDPAGGPANAALLAVADTSVPEPATGALTLLALGSAGLVKRRRA